MRIFGIAVLVLVVSSCMPKISDIIESQVPDIEEIKPEVPPSVEKVIPIFN